MAKTLYTKEFREGAVERLRGCEDIVALAKQLGDRGDSSTGGAMNCIQRSQGWEEHQRHGRASTLRKEVNHLKRVLAEKTLEVDFFRSALLKVEARRQQSSSSGEKASKTKSGK